MNRITFMKEKDRPECAHCHWNKTDESGRVIEYSVMSCREVPFATIIGRTCKSCKFFDGTYPEMTCERFVHKFQKNTRTCSNCEFFGRNDSVFNKTKICYAPEIAGKETFPANEACKYFGPTQGASFLWQLECGPEYLAMMEKFYPDDD